MAKYPRKTKVLEVNDKKFLAAICQIVDKPGTDVAVDYLAEVAPGIFLARETDGEVIAYVNLNTYQQSPDFDPDISNLRERNLLPEDMGVVQAVMLRSLPVIIDLAKRMVVQKNGAAPEWYAREIRVR